MEKVIKEFIYKTVKFLANVVLRVYFRCIAIDGKENIPREGPFIYAVNHQNAFLDAIIVGALSPVPTYFMTRSDVFKPPFDWFLDALKMMPIYRIRDGYDTLTRNESVFLTCKELLERKKAILIFPEGNHGLEYYLRPLTKGISRIAMQSQEAMNIPIRIIPVGLNYHDHFNSGHKLLIKYGAPISVQDRMPLYNEHKHKGLLHQTKAIASGMKTTLVIPADSEEYPSEKKIFQRKYESFSFRELQAKLSNKEVISEEKSFPFVGVIGELFGVFNFLPLWMTKYILKTKVSQKIFYGSIKVAALILIFPIWFLLCFAIIGFFWGITEAVIFFVIQLTTLLIRRELVRLSH